MAQIKYQNEMKRFEKDMIKHWHQALGNDSLPPQDIVNQAGIFAEKLCRAMYIHVFQKIPKTIDFSEIIQEFKRKGIIDNQFESYANHFRHDSNLYRHETPNYTSFYANVTLYKMVGMINWYMKYTGKVFNNLKLNLYAKKCNNNMASLLVDLVDDGVMTYEELLDGPANDSTITNDYQMESLERISDEPIYVGLLIDESGSMYLEAEKVINGQNQALKAIRDSLVCRSGHLHLLQQIFHHQTRIVNPLSKLDPKGKDKVALLSKKNYNPIYGYGLTHLYDALFQHIMLLSVEAERTIKTTGKMPQITIGVFTDGADNTSEKYSASDVSKLVDSLREKRLLKSAIVLGWKSKSFTEKELIKLKRAIGFDEYLGFEMNDPKGIRRAFDLWSQQTIS